MIKGLIVKVFFALCKILLPEKYFDEIFITEFLYTKKLKGLKFINKIWCFKNGFLPFEYVWYDLGKNDYRNYIPVRSNYKKRILNGNFNAILANKLIFETHIKAVSYGIEKLHVIESIGFIENGHLRSLNKSPVTGEFSSLVTVLEKNDLVIKPTIGDGGVGLLMVKKENDSYSLNNKTVSWEELIGVFKNLDHCLIQEKFKQKGFSNTINPGSVNTIRIGTMIDPVTQKPFIAYAIHRFGSPQSGFMDNINQGGIGSMIDLTDGTLGEGKCYSIMGEKEIYQIHPISLKPIFNEKIPGWTSVTDRLVEMAGRMPYLKYVGWDIILSEDELFVLEGNVSPGLGLVQAHKPMSELPAAWDFFRYHKYI